MEFQLVEQVISYLKTIQDYVSFLEAYLDPQAYDEFDKAYVSFFEDFKLFVKQAYSKEASGLKTLVEEFGEIKIPVEKSMIAFCLEGLKQHTNALSSCESEKKRIYGHYLEKCLGMKEIQFLEHMNQRQWKAFDSFVFDVKDADQLHHYMRVNDISN